MALNFVLQPEVGIESKQLLFNPRYQVGVTQEWKHYSEHIPPTDRPPLRKDSEQGRYATRCIGFVEIGRYKYAVVRGYTTSGEWAEMQGKLVDHEYFTLEPVIDLESNTYVPDITSVLGRVGLKINFTLAEVDNFSFTMSRFIPPEIEDGNDLELQLVLENIAPILRQEILEGEPMFQFTD